MPRTYITGSSLDSQHQPSSCASTQGCFSTHVCKCGVYVLHSTVHTVHMKWLCVPVCSTRLCSCAQHSGNSSRDSQNQLSLSNSFLSVLAYHIYVCTLLHTYISTANQTILKILFLHNEQSKRCLIVLASSILCVMYV